MAVRIATFNIENLMARFDFSGFRNPAKADRATRLFEVESEAMYQRLEEARVMASTDDTRQLSALAILHADADVICLQEVESLEALKAFDDAYLYRMIGEGYRLKVLIEGNDSRGIDVALMMRDRTRAGETIELVDVRSHAAVTFRELDLFNAALAETEKADGRIFRRDCLEVDLRIGSKPLTLYVGHLKSMNTPRNGMDGRIATMGLRAAETSAFRKIIERRFGMENLDRASFVICGDMNDYQERIVISGDIRNGLSFEHRMEERSALDVFSHDGFVVNPMLKRPEIDRWTLFHSRGPDERHLCQLDYIWLSPALDRANPAAVPEIIRNGQPFRTPFPSGQQVERFPRTGWDRPKASDHCPVVIAIVLP